MQILRTLPKLAILAVLLISNTAIPLYAQRQPHQNYQIKAVYLYNFTQFVEWPDTVLPKGDAPLVIGIVGEDPFGSYLDEVVQGEEINGHPLHIRRFGHQEEIKDCHILFINLPDSAKTENILASLKGQSVLTVSDVPYFLEKGGMIKFIAVDKKIQFQINPDASNSADLKISSKLLRLAEIVTPSNH